MTKETLQEIITKSKELGISEKEYALSIGITKQLYNYKKKYGLLQYARGKNPGSNNKKPIYRCNDNYFSIVNKNNSYWAGVIAADGHIKKNRHALQLGFKTGDREYLNRFKNDISSESPIYDRIVTTNSKEFYYSSIEISSKKMCQDLENNFNIINNKSLTLQPPILNDNFFDYYIKGYIDGDGCIGYKKHGSKQSSLRISITGTKKVLEKIHGRFIALTNDNKGLYIYQRNNIFVLDVTGRAARTIFLHYYNLSYGFDRKWKKEYYDYCVNWIDSKTTKHDEKRKKIFNLLKTKTVPEVARILNCTPENIYAIRKHNRYNFINNIETEESFTNEENS